jgi:hypothetical protein
MRVLDNRSLGRLQSLGQGFALRISLPLVGQSIISINRLQYLSYSEK